MQATFRLEGSLEDGGLIAEALENLRDGIAKELDGEYKADLAAPGYVKGQPPSLAFQRKHKKYLALERLCREVSSGNQEG